MLTPDIDNIADAPPVESHQEHKTEIAPEIDPLDAYMECFDIVDNRNTQLSILAGQIGCQQNQGARLVVALNFIAEQQKLNNEMYDLIVNMSNYLTSSSN